MPGSLGKVTTKSVKQLFVDTTVHGFRYLVESRSFFDKILWFIAIVVAFSYCTYFIVATVKENDDNPITSYVEVISINETDAPAITVMPPLVSWSGHISPPYRFMTTALNSLTYDCDDVFYYMESEHYAECMEKAKPLRDAFRPLVADVVRWMRDRWREENELHKWGHFFRRNHQFLGADMLFSPQGGAMCKLNETHAVLEDDTDFLETATDAFKNQVDHEEMTMINYFWNALMGGNETDSLFADCSPVELRKESEYAHLLDTMDMIKNSFHEPLPLGYLYEFAKTVAMSEEFGEDIYLLTNGITEELPDKILNGLLEQINMNDIWYSRHFNTGYKSIKDTWLTSVEALCQEKPHYLDAQCFEENVRKDLQNALKGFKYLFQPATPVIYKDSSYARDLLKFLDEASQYPTNCGIDQETCENSDPIMRHCHLVLNHNVSQTDCSAFHATFGHFGLHYSFNQAPFWEMYERNEYMEIFYDEVFVNGPHLKQDIVPSANSFMADFHIYPATPELFDRTEIFPFLAIHHPSNLPSERISLQSGFLYKITVTPSFITTDKELIDVPEAKRGCHFAEEGPVNAGSSMFKNYSQSNCFFECKLQAAYKKVNCMPFEYPHFEDPVSVCGIYTNASKFLEEYDAVSLDACDCPSDCDIYKYDLAINKEPVQGEGCKTPPSCNSVLQFLSRQRAGPVFYLEESAPPSCIKYCKDQVTRVIVKMSSGAITHTKRVRKTSFADQMASFGGILGLFTGMSVLSIFELVMWIKRTLGLCLVGARNKQEKGQNDKEGKTATVNPA